MKTAKKCLALLSLVLSVAFGIAWLGDAAFWIDAQAGHSTFDFWLFWSWLIKTFLIAIWIIGSISILEKNSTK
jgi:hypothetical protein